ncbi:hypothetical protein WJX73_006011 [Symbiochloris irregularis]|uniref:Secreted protein n=1 Tax=Symbiochloris irregularis TaxID=706552 RepID=A0AAW1NST0_9CHLO
MLASSRTCAVALATALTLALAVGQQDSPCPVSLNGNPSYTTSSNLLGKGEKDIVSATPNSGGGCNVVAIPFKDFYSTLGAKFCKKPSSATVTSPKQNLGISPTTTTNIDLGGASTVGFSAGRRLLQAFQCGNRSRWATTVIVYQMRRSQSISNVFYTIAKTADGQTLFGTATDGSCLGPNFLNIGAWLQANKMSLQGLCRQQGVSS